MTVMLTVMRLKVNKVSDGSHSRAGSTVTVAAGADRENKNEPYALSPLFLHLSQRSTISSAIEQQYHNIIIVVMCVFGRPYILPSGRPLLVAKGVECLLLISRVFIVKAPRSS